MPKSRTNPIPARIKGRVREGGNRRSYHYRPDGASKDGTTHTDKDYRKWLEEIRWEVLRQESVPEYDGGHELFLTREPTLPGN